MHANPQQILQHLEEELSHRLEKLWRVFSWCSSILLSLIGGIIVATRGIAKFNLLAQDRTIFTCLILIIVLYGWLWIRENLKLETRLRDEIDKIFEEDFQYSALRKLRPDKARFGYAPVLILLGVVALTVIWWI